MVVGILAFLLPMANKENLRTDDRGDKMMPIIGILLFICAKLIEQLKMTVYYCKMVNNLL